MGFSKEDLSKKGFDYEVLVNNIRKTAEETDTTKLDEKAKKRHQIIKLNYHRYLRIEKTFQVSEQLKERIASITNPQFWLLITEESCGDSAQTIPCIHKMVRDNPNITLKFLYRNENPEIMDQFMTDGKRRIPKLIAFDETGNELFQWGPRPEEADDLFYQLRDEENRQKHEALEKVHQWFSRDQCKSLKEEFVGLLTQEKIE